MEHELTFREFYDNFKKIFKHTRGLHLALCWVFIATFIVFPAAFFKAGFDFD